MPIPLIIVLAVIAGMLLIIFILILGIYAFIFYSPRKGQISNAGLLESSNFSNYSDKMKNLITTLMNRPYEDVYVNSFDTLKLHARLYENKGSKTVALLFHGYRGASYRDFCGGANEAINMGYNVILTDHRAHGLSQGHSITFGAREVQDVLSWVNYARNRFGNDINIVLIGISMGGATVLMAADKIEGNVKIIADSPYASTKLMLIDTLKTIHLPVFIFYPLLRLSALVFVHTNINKYSAFDSIKKTNHPVLIIHGDKDSVVHQNLSQKLFIEYQDRIRYESFEGADHGESYLINTNRYQKIIADFLNK